MRREHSIEPEYFEALFRQHGDPWHFETSAYEAAKYAATIDALPPQPFEKALEVGCANGVLTHALATFCRTLLAVDVSETALTRARERCADLSNVSFELRKLPDDPPPGLFDLVLLSEVIYYWDLHDLQRMADYLLTAMAPGGHVLLVHWTGETDYPQSGDEAVGALAAMLGEAFYEVEATRHELYRLDLWRRG